MKSRNAYAGNEDKNGMRLVVIESPLAGDFERNIRYARLCALDCLRRGEAPYASHLFFTQMLDDEAESERELGIQAGFAWAGAAAARVVYTDLGISGGMKRGIEAATGDWFSQRVEFRTLPEDLMAKLDDKATVDNMATKGAV